MIVSLHHLTATVDEARPDLDFYRGLLGFRLVKKTVNFDNHFVYHFYYGDELGRPSTLMTTFPYHGWKVAQGVHGAGQITTTSFAVPAASIGFWTERLAATGLAPVPGTRFGAPTVTVTDPSGLVIELAGVTGDDRSPWTGAGVPAASAVRGLASAILTVRDPAKTVDFLREMLGFTTVGTEGDTTRVAVGGDRSGHRLDILRAAPDTPDAVNGIGTVHHVALAIDTGEAQLELRERLVERGVKVTEIRERKYFRSIYFREPGGVLLEVATVGPGFAVDEPVATLGESLELPDWEEANRTEIEARLERLD